MISQKFRTVVITGVMSVWAFNVFAGAFIESYHPTESINGIFMVVVGSLFMVGTKNGEKDA